MSGLAEYKCPCCGGAIEFNSSIQKMKCPYCDTEFDMEAIQEYETEAAQEQADDMHWETQPGGEWEHGETAGMRIYNCQSCGAEIISDESTAASSCPYCGNNIVMKEQFSGDLRPDYVIPFKIDKKAAKAALKNHLKGKRLLPKVFKDENHIDEIKGVYVPFWLFDAEADAHLRYKATKINVWSDANYNYTRTSFYSVIRDGSVGFAGVPVDGSSKMEDELMESIEPYNLSEMVDFQTAYLAGYLADRYDVSAEQSIGRANDRIKKTTEQIFAETVRGYSSVIPESSSIRLRNGKAKYALYPVWILNTSWKGKNYKFAMNGQTGKFVGDLPMDKGAYWKWRTIWSAILTAVGCAVLWLIYL